MISNSTNSADECALSSNKKITAKKSKYSRFKIRVPIAIKLALAITLLIIGGMASLGFITLENQKRELNQQINTVGSALARQVASSASELVLSEDNLGLQALVNNLVDNNQIKGAIIISNKNKILSKNGLTPSLDFIQHQINTNKSTNSFKWNTTHTPAEKFICFNSPIKFKQLVAGHIIITFSQQQMMRSLYSSRNVIIYTTILMGLIAILLAFVMSRHLSKPIHNLVEATQAIGAGDFHVRLNEKRNDEIGELASAFNLMAQGLLQKSQVEDVFSRYVSSNVAKKVLQNLDDIELGGKHVTASVLFADIVGFTSISETLPPQEIANLLNEYFTHISTIAQLNNGHIDKFMGDCAMVVFGVPEHSEHHSLNAIKCALMIKDAVIKLNKVRLLENKIPINFRMGINSGEMIAGNLGSNDRMEYTVIGDPVNIASRLAGIAKSNQIVILEELYNQPDIANNIIATQHKVIKIRGKKEPVSTWLVNNTVMEQQKLSANVNKIISHN